MVTRTKKIFVGGLSASTVQADLTSYFSTFGKVEEAMLMFDRQEKGQNQYEKLIRLIKLMNSYGLSKPDKFSRVRNVINTVSTSQISVT